jgi:hypothetical protein
VKNRHSVAVKCDRKAICPTPVIPTGQFPIIFRAQNSYSPTEPTLRTPILPLATTETLNTHTRQILPRLLASPTLVPAVMSWMCPQKLLWDEAHDCLLLRGLKWCKINATQFQVLCIGLLHKAMPHHAVNNFLQRLEVNA